MSEELIVDFSKNDEQKYQKLLPQITSLISETEPIISSFSNITAALKQTFSKISWVGFYFVKGTNLYLGPFQGNIACTILKKGIGVCGTSLESGETIIVDDVNKFKGHIACDSGSRSEIVVPLFYNNKVFAILDIDSYDYNSFNDIDKKYLEELATIISNKLQLDNFILS